MKEKEEENTNNESTEKRKMNGVQNELWNIINKLVCHRE